VVSVLVDLDAFIQTPSLTYAKFVNHLEEEFFTVRFAEMLIRILADPSGNAQYFLNLMTLLSLILPLVGQKSIDEFDSCDGFANLNKIILSYSHSEDDNVLDRIVDSFLTTGFDQSPKVAVREGGALSIPRKTQPFSLILKDFKKFAPDPACSGITRSILKILHHMIRDSPAVCAICQSFSIILEIIQSLNSMSKESQIRSFRLLQAFMRNQIVRSQKQLQESRELVQVLETRPLIRTCKVVFGVMSWSVAKFFGYQSRWDDAEALQAVISWIIDFHQESMENAASEQSEKKGSLLPRKSSLVRSRANSIFEEDDVVDWSSSTESIVSAAFSALFALTQSNTANHLKLNTIPMQKALWESLEHNLGVKAILSVVSNCFSMLKTGDADKRANIRPLCDQYILSLLNALVKPEVTYLSKERVVTLLSEACCDHEHIKNSLYSSEGIGLIVSLLSNTRCDPLDSSESSRTLNYVWSLLVLLRNIVRLSPRQIMEWRRMNLSTRLFEAVKVGFFSSIDDSRQKLFACWSLCLAMDEFPESWKPDDLLTLLSSEDNVIHLSSPFTENAIIVNPEILNLTLDFLCLCSNSFSSSFVNLLILILSRDKLNIVQLSLSNVLQRLLHEFRKFVLEDHDSQSYISFVGTYIPLIKTIMCHSVQPQDVYALLDLISTCSREKRSEILSVIKDILVDNITREHLPYMLFDSRIPGNRAAIIPLPKDFMLFTNKGFTICLWVLFDFIDPRVPEKVFTILDNQGHPALELVYWEHALRIRYRRGDLLEEKIFTQAKLEIGKWHFVVVVQEKNWIFQNQFRLFVDDVPVESAVFIMPPPVSAQVSFLGDVRRTWNSSFKRWKVVSCFMNEGPLSDFQLFRLFSLGATFIHRRRKAKFFDIINGSLFSRQSQVLSQAFGLEVSTTSGTYENVTEPFLSDDQIIFFYHSKGSCLEQRTAEMLIGRLWDLKSSRFGNVAAGFDDRDFVDGYKALLKNEFGDPLKGSFEAVICSGCRLINLHSLSSSLFDCSSMVHLLPCILETTNADELNSLLWTFGYSVARSPVNLLRMDFFQSFYLISLLLQQRPECISTETVQILAKMTGLTDSGKQGTIVNLHAFEAFFLDFAVWNELDSALRVEIIDVIVSGITVNSSWLDNLNLFKLLRRRMAKWCILLIFHKDENEDLVLDEKRINSGIQIMEILLQHGDIQKQGLRLILDFILGTVECFQLDNLMHKDWLEEFLASQRSSQSMISVPEINLNLNDSQRSFKVKISLMQLLLRVMLKSSSYDSEVFYQYFDGNSGRTLWGWILEMIDSDFLFCLLTSDVHMDTESPTAYLTVRMLYLILRGSKNMSSKFVQEDGFRKLALLLTPYRRQTIVFKVLIHAFLGNFDIFDEKDTDFSSITKFVRIFLNGKSEKERNAFVPSFTQFAEVFLSLLVELVYELSDSTSASITVAVLNSLAFMVKSSQSLCRLFAQERLLFFLTNVAFSPALEETLANSDAVLLWTQRDSHILVNCQILSCLFEVISSILIFSLSNSADGCAFMECALSFIPPGASEKARNTFLTVLSLTISNFISTCLNRGPSFHVSEMLMKNFTTSCDTLVGLSNRSVMTPASSVFHVMHAFMDVLHQVDVFSRPTALDDLKVQEEMYTKASCSLNMIITSVLIRTKDLHILEEAHAFLLANHQILLSRLNADQKFILCLYLILISELLNPMLKEIRIFVAQVLTSVLKEKIEVLEPMLQHTLSSGKHVNLVEDGFELLLSGQYTQFFNWFEANSTAVVGLTKKFAEIQAKMESENDLNTFELFARLEDSSSKFKSQDKELKDWQADALGILTELRKHEITQRRKDQMDYTFCIQRDRLEMTKYYEQQWNLIDAIIHDVSQLQELTLNEFNFETPWTSSSRWRLDPLESSLGCIRKRLHKANDYMVGSPSTKGRFSLTMLMKSESDSLGNEAENDSADIHKDEKMPVSPSSSLHWDVPRYFVFHRLGRTMSDVYQEVKRTSVTKLFAEFSEGDDEKFSLESSSSEGDKLRTWLKVMIEPDDLIQSIFFCSRVVLMEERSVSLVFCEKVSYLIENAHHFQGANFEDELSNLSTSQVLVKSTRTVLQYSDIVEARVCRFMHQGRALEVLLADGFWFFFAFKTAKDAQKALKILNSKRFDCISIVFN
jgi:hypothetical protein